MPDGGQPPICRSGFCCCKGKSGPLGSPASDSLFSAIARLGNPDFSLSFLTVEVIVKEIGGHHKSVRSLILFAGVLVTVPETASRVSKTNPQTRHCTQMGQSSAPRALCRRPCPTINSGSENVMQTRSIPGYQRFSPESKISS